MMEWLFWSSAAGVVYAYVGYPFVVYLLARLRPEPSWSATSELPSVSMIVPVYNERDTIAAKLANTRSLDYPSDRLEVLFVSDGSTDGTVEYIETHAGPGMIAVPLATRGGKAKALNEGLARARHDIVVYSDAAIELAPDSLRRIVEPFAAPTVGSVSGEDHIAALGGEALYGRYELFLRRQESRLHSIVGASGSFYAQRRALCAPFVPNYAPDFLSVLRTAEQGYRSLAEPRAIGRMEAVSSPRDEFDRKVRTLLRGLTTLGAHAHLLNPFRYGWFAFALFSHKLMRWLVPVFLIVCLVSSAVLAMGSSWYAAIFIAQVVFYLLALLGMRGAGAIAGALPVRAASYFTNVNLATLAAWIKYVSGVRQELWSPSKRQA